jgi:hypothetical protein
MVAKMAEESEDWAKTNGMEATTRASKLLKSLILMDQ